MVDYIQARSMYHDNNMTMKQIGKHFGVSRQRVHQVLKRGRPALSISERQTVDYKRAKELFAQGLPVKQIANELGCSVTSLYRNEMRHTYARERIDLDVVRSMMKGGEPISYVAEMCKCSVQTLNHLGIHQRDFLGVASGAVCR